MERERPVLILPFRKTECRANKVCMLRADKTANLSFHGLTPGGNSEEKNRLGIVREPVCMCGGQGGTTVKGLALVKQIS